MKESWLIRKNNPHCLLFMAGWSMGPEPFTELTTGEQDLFLCYDYRSLDLPDLSWISTYERVDLLAWSMGVWVAARVFSGQKNRFTSATALAGTLQPIDDSRGIPVAAYDTMLARLDADGLKKFHASMFDTPGEQTRFMTNPPARSPASAQKELACLRDHVEKSGEVPDIYDNHIITIRDRIFPARNQVRAWGRARCRQKKWPHFPFYRHDSSLFLQVECF